MSNVTQESIDKSLGMDRLDLAAEVIGGPVGSVALLLLVAS